MKLILLCLSLFIGAPLMAQKTTGTPDLVELVNPLMGTDSKVSLSNGNTLSSSSLANKSTAANWLKNIYAGQGWIRS